MKSLPLQSQEQIQGALFLCSELIDGAEGWLAEMNETLKRSTGIIVF